MKKRPGESKLIARGLDRREFLLGSVILGAFMPKVQGLSSETQIKTNTEHLIANEVGPLITQISSYHFLSSAPAIAPKDSVPINKLPLATKNSHTIGLHEVLGMPLEECKRKYSKGIAFHSVGDTGDEASLTAFLKVVESMNKRLIDNKDIAFFYHLGDVVYEKSGVEREFGTDDIDEGRIENYKKRYAEVLYDPFKNYDRPIFGIPGSHDTQTDYLRAFHDNFCKPNKFRKWMGTQPNIYWRLSMPFANIIGLSTNSFDSYKYQYKVLTNEKKEDLRLHKGDIDDDQLKWFTRMLIECKTDYENENKALIVAMHFPPLDSEVELVGGSDGSPWLYYLTNKAYKESGMFPHLVISGHWHAYQRLNVSRPSGRQGTQAIEQVIHVVAGCGGKTHLYPIAAGPGDRDDLFDGTKVVMGNKWIVSTENTITTENRLYFGFMEMFIDAEHLTGRFITADGIEQDTFVIDIKNRKIIL